MAHVLSSLPRSRIHPEDRARLIRQRLNHVSRNNQTFSFSIFSTCANGLPIAPILKRTPKAGSPEESTLGIRLAGTRDLIFGLLLRDPASAVVERALQLGLINSVLDIVA